MRKFSFLAVVACVGLIVLSVVLQRTRGGRAPRWIEQNAPLMSLPVENVDTENALSSATQRYRLDASQSKFIAHAMAGGLLWFKGHDHLVAVREFTGEAELTPESVNPASLQITAKTASMVETSNVFTEQQKQIIDKELREIVLLPAQYPDISFKSTNVSGKSDGNGQYDLRIGGKLTLQGVTRPIT